LWGQLMRKCPRCGGEARKSQRRGFVQSRILKPLRIRRYRCRECGAAFYRFSTKSHELTGSALFEFKQTQDGNGQFKELIDQIREKERELGLVEPRRHTTEELRELRERARAQGLSGSPSKQETHG